MLKQNALASGLNTLLFFDLVSETVELLPVSKS